MSEATGPLQGLTIIDLTMALAGPFGTAMLADLGANVIKVEPPQGDGSRSAGPLPPDYANTNAAEPAGVDYGAYFASINRNKRSIVLDLKTPADREVLLGLCDQADALVENMRVGVMDDLGLGYEVLHARNPKLVYGCVRGFGDPRTGASPYAEWPSYDVVAQSMSGLVGMTGPEGSAGYPTGVSVGDIYPGTLMALGVLAAIHRAQATGQGQFCDVGMYDGMLAFNETTIANYGYAKQTLAPAGRHHPTLMPFGLFATSDGAVAIGALNPKHWAALCRAMDREDLLTDQRTRNTFVRKRHHAFVEEAIVAWTSVQSSAAVMAAIGGVVPCGPVQNAADIFADPHVAARNMITEFELPGANPPVAIVGSPIKYTETPTGLYRRPPLLGEHTEEVLQEFGIQRPPTD